MYTNFNPNNYDVLFVACSAGYSGPDCSIPSSYPNYGVGCQFKCVCGLKICSHILGCQKIIGSSSNAKYIFVRN